MPSEALLELLNKCRSNNSKLGLTEIFLHKDGNFRQVLDGPEQQGQALLEKNWFVFSFGTLQFMRRRRVAHKMELHGDGSNWLLEELFTAEGWKSTYS